MSKVSPQLASRTAQAIHYELIARSASFDGVRARDVCASHDGVIAALSGSMPGHTSRVLADGAMGALSRHEGELTTLRAMAFGRWSPTHLWVLTRDAKAKREIIEESRRWGTFTVEAPDGRSFDRSEWLVALRCETQATSREAAPDAAVRALRTNPRADEATPLELQLELLRRTRFNRFDGPRIYRDLVEHRDLWRAAVFGRDDVVFVERDGRRVHASPVWNTINLLREEESEGYNADQVWIVAPSAEAGRAVLDLARARWKADERRLWNRANSRRVAACVDDERVVSLWWD